MLMCFKRTFVGAALVTAALFSGAAFGQTQTAAATAAVSGEAVNFKCPAPGTVVQLSNNARVFWLGAQGQGCRRELALPSGAKVQQIWYAPTFIGNPNQSQAFFEQTKPWDLWPLTVGKKMTGRFDGPGSDPGFTGSWLYTTVVEKQERLRTPAGVFDVFVVARKEEALGGTFKSTMREWYAPKLGVSVKTSYSDNNAVDNAQEAVAIRQH